MEKNKKKRGVRENRETMGLVKMNKTREFYRRGVKSFTVKNSIAKSIGKKQNKERVKGKEKRNQVIGLERKRSTKGKGSSTETKVGKMGVTGDTKDCRHWDKHVYVGKKGGGGGKNRNFGRGGGGGGASKFDWKREEVENEGLALDYG